MQTILLLEDDVSLSGGITMKLTKEGYRVLAADTIRGAKELFRKESEIALVICDITLPDGSGLEFGRWVRKQSHVYLMYLTALDGELDMVNGYDTGADDYMTKPFSIAVLTAKIHALMGRLGGRDAAMLRSREFTFYTREMKVEKDGAEIALSRTELSLLRLLMECAGRVLTKEQILEQVWGLDGEFVDDNTVTVNISRLKSKLETDYIANVRGLGYLWTEEVSGQLR